MQRAYGTVSRRAKRVFWAGVVLIAAAAAGPARAASPPEIRSSPTNRVPACVTPDRLMAFVATRNTNLAPKFTGIALAYRDLGEAWHIRWDYAFYQMLLETNYLMYRRGDGNAGDVGLTQNNFAGIGATGGGVPGDRYPDVRTGVLAQMQHLVAYSGERVERPVAQRTREYQGDIIEISRKLGRPVTFADLSRRWAADRGYGKNIETVAELFRRTHCNGAPLAPLKEARAMTTLPPPSKLGAPADRDTQAGSAAPVAGADAQPARSSLVRTIWRRGDPIPPAPRLAEPRPAAVVAAAPVVAAEDTAAAPALPPPALVRPPAVISAAEVRRNEAAAATGAGRFAIAAKGAMGSIGATAVSPPAQARLEPQAAPQSPPVCRIYSASYGGSRAVLIRSQAGNETRLTAVMVEEAASQSMAASYVATHALGGQVLGTYGDKDAALTAARQLCPQG